MPAAQARALFEPGGIRIEPFDPASDARSLRRLAVWAQQLSPLVEIDPPDGLLLDTSGCDRVFGTEQRLVERAAVSMNGLGIQARVVIAPTFAAARSLARYGPEPTAVIPGSARLEDVLAPLPIAALDAEPATVAALAEIGIERIGHLLELPRSCLPSRFGPSLLLRLDQALGRSFEAIEPVRETEPVSASIAFDGPTVQTEAIELATRALLADVTRRLGERECGARQLEIVLDRSDLEPETVTLSLSRPSRDATHLLRLARPRLERVHLGFGVERLTIRVGVSARIPHRQSEHCDSAAADSDTESAFGDFVDAVVNRLGPSAAMSPRLRALRRPEHAAEIVPVSDANASRPVHPVDADRPSILLDQPEPAQVVALTPDGPVHSVRWRGHDHAVTRCVGPERIGHEWWRSPGTTRDYFRVRTESGLWLWLARALEPNRWFVHGVWA